MWPIIYNRTNLSGSPLDYVGNILDTAQGGVQLIAVVCYLVHIKYIVDHHWKSTILPNSHQNRPTQQKWFLRGHIQYGIFALCGA